jgi:hypothetical protein
MNHCGHWLLCEIEALSKIVHSAQARLVDEWIDCGLHFIDTAKLIPEIKPTSSAKGSDGIFRNSLLDGHFVVLPRIGHYFIGSSAKAGIRKYIDEWKAQSGFDQYLKHKLTGKWPVIWMEWRANDRLWLNQKEGLAALIQRLRSRYPDFAIVIGGWSRMNVERPSDEAMIEKEEVIFSEVAELFGAAQAYFVSGESLINKFAWADNCDAYACIHGTGLVFPLIAGIHGTTITSQHDYGRIHKARTGVPEYVYGQEELSFVPAEFVKDEETKLGYALTNFDVDPNGFADFFEAKILARLPRRQGR